MKFFKNKSMALQTRFNAGRGELPLNNAQVYDEKHAGNLSCILISSIHPSLLVWLSAALFFFTACSLFAASGPVRVWEKQELTFTADNHYSNAYTQVVVWVDLSGPDFDKRVYGFWDGGQTFRVRFVATAPGNWSWKSGSSPNDPGLDDKTGSFTAITWTEAELKENPLRHGFLRASANNHALDYADGTPFLAIGDTWYSLGT
ncbi:MAG TPA: DUF5060 domain-containing protein, partial [Candidatus Kryptobacter bacterium]|nr:DUF5060 domain-containing protein [Candidatus Kryptobacter bacterium]